MDMQNNTKKLGFGLMRLPLVDPGDRTRIDMPQLIRMVDAFLESGFLYFDTAYMYHGYTSESAVREALVRRHPRDSYMLATKMPTMFLKTKDGLERIFNEQLAKCGVEYFDYYLLHNLGAYHYAVAKELGAFEFIQKKKEEGRILHTGFSFHDTADVLDDVLTAHPEVDMVQLQLNYLDWESESIQSRKCYETARAHQKPIVGMEPVKGGTLAALPPPAEKLLRDVAPRRSPSSWAIRFAASHEGVELILSGMSELAQLLENTETMGDFSPMTDAEFAIVGQVAAMLQNSAAIPCTACGYCEETCPKQIPIRRYFSLYNAEKHALNKGFSTQQTYYENVVATFPTPSDCIRCNECETQCPQHLPVPDLLEDVAKAFE